MGGMRGVAAQNSAWWEMHLLDAELLGCAPDGIDPWVGFTGMALGLGHGVVCVPLPLLPLSLLPLKPDDSLVLGWDQLPV